MNNINHTQVLAGPTSTRTDAPQRAGVRKLVGRGLLTAVAAAAVTTLVAALAKGAGVAFQIPDGGQTIPLSGIAFVTGVFSVVGVVIAAALLRWSAHPTKRFVHVAMTLTVISAVPPWVVGASAATSFALVGLHLVAATIMIPALARSIRGSST